MSTKTDIEIIDKAFVEISHPEAVVDAWHRVKLYISAMERECNCETNSKTDK